MSLDAKLIVAAVALVIVLPMAAIVLRRLIRSEPFRKPEMGDMQMSPPSGPSIDGGGV